MGKLRKTSILCITSIAILILQFFIVSTMLVVVKPVEVPKLIVDWVNVDKPLIKDAYVINEAAGEFSTTITIRIKTSDGTIPQGNVTYTWWVSPFLNGTFIPGDRFVKNPADQSDWNTCTVIWVVPVNIWNTTRYYTVRYEVRNTQCITGEGGVLFAVQPIPEFPATTLTLTILMLATIALTKKRKQLTRLYFSH